MTPTSPYAPPYAAFSQPFVALRKKICRGLPFLFYFIQRLLGPLQHSDATVRAMPSERSNVERPRQATTRERLLPNQCSSDLTDKIGHVIQQFPLKEAPSFSNAPPRCDSSCLGHDEARVRIKSPLPLEMLFI